MQRDRRNGNVAETWSAARDETRRLARGPEGLEVLVQAGCLLVTRAGDHEDHVLGPGELLRVTGPGLVVAWALEPSQVVLTRPRKASGRRPTLQQAA
jgi:hypothetical protein